MVKKLEDGMILPITNSSKIFQILGTQSTDIDASVVRKYFLFKKGGNNMLSGWNRVVENVYVMYLRTGSILTQLVRVFQLAQKGIWKEKSWRNYKS